MMNRHSAIFTVLFLLVISGNSCAQISQPEIFVGSTPCSQGTRPLPGMYAEEPCELLKWKLTLSPGRFTLHCSYGLPKQGTTGFIAGGKTIDMEGHWVITKGRATDHGETVYRLTDSKTNKTVSFLKLGDDLLHLLDADEHLMTGSAAWSYTLNRIPHS